MPSKEINQIKKYAESLGFSTKITKKGHIVFSGFGRKVLSSSTPSDFRVIVTLRKNLKKIANGQPIARL
jgi:hypothetical protein